MGVNLYQGFVTRWAYLLEIRIRPRASAMKSCAYVVEDEEKSGRPLALQKLDDDGVVEVINCHPPNILGYVFFLEE